MRKENFKKVFLMLLLVFTVMIGMAVTAQAEEYSGTAKGTKWTVNTDTGVLTIDVEGPMGSWTQGSQPWYKYRSYITSLDFPAATSKITNYAFSDLVNLKTIEIPNSVEEIGSYAFINCQSATELYIPISIVTWGGYVFKGCASIDYIFTENQANITQTAPIWDASVGSAAADGQVELQIESKSIGQYAFYGLSSVTNVKLPTTLTGINSYAFYGFTSPFALNMTSATNIGQYAFYGCTGVTSIDLPVVTTIGAHAFDGCTGTSVINIPIATDIGEYAFYNCSAAKSINVNATSCNYGNHCFANCSSVEAMYLGSIDFASGSNVLDGTGNTKSFEITLGKSITAINGSLQNTFIGAPNAISLKLEGGSQLSSIAASAFSGNTTIKSVDLSNAAGTFTIGEKAFYNCKNIVSFSTPSGATTYGQDCLQEMINCAEFCYNSKSATVQGISKTINITNATTAWTTSGGSGSSSSNANVQYSTQTNWSAWTNSSNNTTYYYNYANGVTSVYGPITNNVSGLQSSISPDYQLTYTHPFQNLGKSNGCNITIGSSVEQIPANLFSSGLRERINSSMPTTSGSGGVANINPTAAARSNIYTTQIQNNYPNSNFGGNMNYPAATISQKVGSFSASAATATSIKTASSGITIKSVSCDNDSLLNTIGQNAFGVEEYTTAVSLSIKNPTATSIGAATVAYTGGNASLTMVAGINTWPSPVEYGSVPVSTTVSNITCSGTAAISNVSYSSQTSLTAESTSNAAGGGITSVILGTVSKSCSIEDGAFGYNSALAKVYIGSGVTNIEPAAFIGAAASGAIYVYGKTSNTFSPTSNNGLTSGGSCPITNIVYLPNAKDYGELIEQYAVGANATAYLYKTTGDNYLINISGAGATYSTFTAETHPGWFADYGKKVKDVIVDSNITNIGQYMFYGHDSLEDLKLPDTITTIEACAFAGCSKLPALQTYPSALTKIGNQAFANCSIMESVSIPSTVTSLGSKIFENCPIVKIEYNATNASDVTDATHPFGGTDSSKEFSIIVGQNVIKIPSFMFYQSTAKKLTIGASVNSIGTGALSGANSMDLAIAAGNLSYVVGKDGNLYTADGLTMVTYLGKLADEYYSLPTTITKIATGAFYGQQHLKQVSFDATIKEIGTYAFYACPNLETIAISDFMDEDSFNAEVATDKTTWFGSATVIYSGLTWDVGVTKGALTAVLYSDGTLTISGTGAMKSWAAAPSVEWYAKRGSITKVTFDGTCTSIGAYAFSGCNNLKTISMPSTVNDIGQYAFYGCTNLAFVRVPDAVTKINTYTFANCVNLEYTDLGSGMTSLEPFAFAGCTNARYISINGTVNEVKTNAFQGDKNMTLLIMDKKADTDFSTHDGIVKSDVFRICYMPDIKSGHLTGRYAGNEATGLYTGYAVETDLYAYAFDSDGDGKGDYLHIAGASAMQTTWASFDAVPWKSLQHTLTKVYIEDDVTSVGPYAFENCDALKYAHIGQGAATISTHSFYGCSALEKLVCDVRLYNTGSLTTSSNVFVNAGSPNGFTVIFDNDATRIPGYMFYNCANLSNLTIGKSIESINSYAFAGCTGLKTMYLQGSNITSTDANGFANAGTKSGGFTLEIASNVTKIPDSIFYAESGNPYITSVTVDAGSKLQSIGSRAFAGCNRLDSASFENCSLLKYIQSEAFLDCTRLVTVNFNNCSELYTISGAAFKNCMNLAAFTINNCNKLHEIGASAFDGTTQVPNIVLPASVTIVNSNSFGNWVRDQIIFVLGKTDQSGFTSATSSWSGNATVIYTRLTWDMSKNGDGSIIAYYCVPDSQQVSTAYAIFVTGKGDMKDFESADTVNWPGVSSTSDIRDTVTKLVINDGITRIGNNDFAGFTKCSSLSIGSGVKEIGKNAFGGDKLIPEVDLSVARANLTLIDADAFTGCSGVSTVNLSGCDVLTSVGNNAFKDLAGSSVVYVSSDYLYDMLANVNGNIKSTYGTTSNTKVSSVKVVFSKDLSSQGVVAGSTVTWSVEATCTDNLTFTWYYATEQGGQWTEITSAMNGFTVNSTTKTSVLTMDSSIVTLDKNGWYFYCAANSPYYNAESSKAALAVYSAAITPVVTVVDKNGDSLESNTWTQGPLSIYITPGSASNGITPTYQYKLKASGSWRNVENQMTYNTEGIVTFYCRAIINGDNNTASTPVKYILKVDNTNPEVSIAADPQFESTDSVKLTATATDQTSGVKSVTWYKTAADANDSNMNSGVTGYVPLLTGVDMNTMTLSVRHFDNTSGYTADVYTTTYVGKNETHNATMDTTLNTANESDLLANYAAANAAVTSHALDLFNLYEVHVMDKDNSDYGISASNKGIVTIPVPTSYDTTRLAVYTFSKAGTLVPVSSFTLSTGKDSVTFAVPAFGQFLIGEKPMPTTEP